MDLTRNLRLPQYSEEDIFDLQDINKAYNDIDNAYEEIIDFKEEIPKVNANAEIIEARDGEETLGAKIRKFNKQLDNIAIQVSNKEELDDAINIIKNNKGGTILLKNDIQLVENISLYKEKIYVLDSLDKFEILGNGFSFLVDDTNQSAIYEVFSLSNTKNIKISSLNIKGNIDRYPFSSSEGRYVDYGAVLVCLYENNQNIILENINSENINSICIAKRTNNDGNLFINKSKNITLNNLSGTSITYPLNFRFNGDNVIGRNLKFDKVHRGYFPYGVKNHDIEIEVSNFDATACLLNAYFGHGLENIKLKCISKNNSNEKTPVTSKTVQLKYGDKTNASFKNIEIIVDVENIYNKVDNVFDISYDGSGTGEEKHILDGLKLSGTINGCVQGAINFTSYNGGSLESATFKNITLNDLEINNQGANSIFDISALEGKCLIDNLNINGVYSRMYLIKNDNKESNIIIKKCKCGQITQNNFNNRAIYEDCTFTDDWQFNFNDKILRNTIINNKLYNIEKINPMFDENNLITRWWNQFPSTLLNKEYNDLGNLTTYTFDVELDSNILQLGSRYTQPNIFNFYISYQNSFYNRVGIITGKLFLKSDKQSSVTLSELFVINKNFTSLKSSITADATLSVVNGKIQIVLTTSGQALNNIGFTLTT